MIVRLLFVFVSEGYNLLDYILTISSVKSVSTICRIENVRVVEGEGGGGEVGGVSTGARPRIIIIVLAAIAIYVHCRVWRMMADAKTTKLQGVRCL